MAEPFKLLLNAPLVQRCGQRLCAAWPGFDAAHFTRQAVDGLDGLEMKARALHICGALEATLPPDFDTAAAVLLQALQEPEPLSGWILWPVGEYVARRGIDTPGRALEVLHALTQRFTAEWAIRPFIVAHPQLVFETLARWARDPNEHVRRLVSEGSRPRLPWGIRLAALVADPSPTLPLLAQLQDDGSEYVRRSVANHLNDIAKDHPALVADWLEAHLDGAPPERRALLRHASRTLIKQGHRRVLAAWGLARPLQGHARLALKPRTVRLGGQIELAVTLASTARRPQKLAIDYAVHHVKADGSLSPKVFKGWLVELAAGEERSLARRHPLKPVTTRRYHPGQHRIELLVNGRSEAAADFTLRLDAA